MLYVCVHQPVSNGVLLVTKLDLKFFPCMKLPTTDLRRSEVHVVHKSPPLSLQADNKGRKALSLSLASVAHQTNPKLGCLLGKTSQLTFILSLFARKSEGCLFIIHLPASVPRASRVQNKDHLTTLCQELCNSCACVVPPEAFPHWQVLTPLTPPPSAKELSEVVAYLRGGT